jgi:hypothetical protein
MQEKSILTCATCKKKLTEGHLAIQVTEGIIGVNDFVPLDSPTVFCNFDCLLKYVDKDVGRAWMPKRIP